MLRVSIAFWRLPDDWESRDGGDVEHPCRKKTQVPTQPSWRPIPCGKSARYGPPVLQPSKTLLSSAPFLGRLASKVQFAPLVRHPGRPQTSWASLIPSPSLFKSAPPTPRSHTGFVGKVYPWSTTASDLGYSTYPVCHSFFVCSPQHDQQLSSLTHIDRSLIGL